MLVAEGAELLASLIRHASQQPELCQTAQAAGILHNIGLLWLADRLPRQTASALHASMQDNSVSVAEGLRQFAETDYCEIGGWLADFWALPDMLVAPIRDHLGPLDKDRSSALVVVIKAAVGMASFLLKGQDQPFEAFDLNDWGIEDAQQGDVLQQLGKRCEKTRKLAESLFIQ